eukprot:TRINITY_DN11115_c0_g1_i1.p1 TRINITY_DN11115_c0_g1~~TRINITY_DN11115_c0_g1_i1.p1  ORF type:complete len:803 (-),score=209.77 TRINITY_DN11115_c0_g1_i1:27-2414(-)
MHTAAIKLLVLVSFITATIVSSQDMPDLPPQFSTGVEFTIADKSYSAEFYEYYDSVNSRVRFDFYEQGNHEIDLYLPNEDNGGEHYKVINFGEECTLTSIAEEPNSFIKSGSTLPTTASWLGVDAEGATKDPSTSEVRGIECDSWSYTIDNSNITANVVIYFSVESWDSRGSENPDHRVPVQITVSGDILVGEGSPRSFDHVYSYFGFTSSTLSDSIFEKPTWWDCGSIVEKPFPTLPSKFYTYVEIANEGTNDNNFTTFEEWYDYDLNMFRSTRITGPHDVETYIWDVAAGSQLHIEEFSHGDHHESTCVREDVPEDFAEFFSTGNHLKLSGSIFHHSDDDEPRYQGTTEERGIECDHWKSNRVVEYNDITFTYVVDHYFSVDGWHLNGFPQETRPISMKIEGTYVEDEEEKSFHVHFSFLDFVSGDEGVIELDFVPPVDAYCPDLNQDLTLPQLPDQFSAVIELSEAHEEYTTHIRQFWDASLQKVRLDYFEHGKHHKEIFNANTKTRYVIDGDTCEKVEQVDEDYVLLNGDDLVDIDDYWLFGDAQSQIYMGKHYARDIRCDVWKSHQITDEYDFHVTWYFSSDDWEIHDGANQHRIPIKVEVDGEPLSEEGDHFHVIYDIVNFVPGEIEPRMFDILPHWACGESDVSNPEYVLNILASMTIESEEFDEDILEGLAEYLEIDVSKIDVLQEFSDGDETVVLFEVVADDPAQRVEIIAKMDKFTDLYVNDVTISEMEHLSSTYSGVVVHKDISNYTGIITILVLVFFFLGSLFGFFAFKCFVGTETRALMSLE